ncbi:MAG: hypothetical protein PHT88_04175 [Candidatus Moranbacteria bacterium]|nr:hypothetical protein [Candidatus Moranbacteria bacterium]
MRVPQFQALGINDQVQYQPTDTLPFDIETDNDPYKEELALIAAGTVFTVAQTCDHGSTAVFYKFEQITRETLSEWSHLNEEAISDIALLKTGMTVIHMPSNVRYVLIRVTENHAHGACSLVVRDNNASQWGLYLKSLLKPF